MAVCQKEMKSPRVCIVHKFLLFVYSWYYVETKMAFTVSRGHLWQRPVVQESNNNIKVLYSARIYQQGTQGAG